MTVAARQLDHDVWSQSRYLIWLKGQPETAHFEFDGASRVALAPATVGLNRIGRNIRDAIRRKLPPNTPCDVYGPQDAIETVGGALREPDAFNACCQPPRTGVVVPAPIVVLEVPSPGRENRRRDEQDKLDEYVSVPTILRYVVVESERRGYKIFWREPGERQWRRSTPDASQPIDLPEFGTLPTLDEVSTGIAFD